MADYKCISFTQDGPKASLVFNRPGVLNALNNQLIDEALDALGRLSSDTRVLVLRGSGDKAFAAGADLDEMQHRTMWTDIGFGARRELARRLEEAPFPTVAAINGFAFGGGLELALACHLRIVSDKSVLGLPETRLGILPANGGTARLTRLVGPGHALKLILLGEHINAQEAERLGVVNWVVAAAEFDDHVRNLTDRLVKLAPIATRAVIDCVLRGVDMTVDQAIENEHRWFQICLASPDKQEGVSAFLEKRQPDFARDR